jgi:uncharacterized protein (TIGR02145 family)
MVPIINLFMKTTLQNSIRPAFSFLVLLIFKMLNLQGQDYLISFAGTGASTSVDSVKIENLTQGTKLKMKGSDILHLMGTTGIETILGDETGNITFYPNPMKDQARMQFVLPEPGETSVTLFDISGRKIAQTRDLLSRGEHIYGIKGIKEGLYIVGISSRGYSYSGRFISSGSQSAVVKIIYENTLTLQEKQSDSKGTNEEKVMQYITGDRLLLKGISTIHSTIVTDVPAASKTITFNFIPCTDKDGNNYSIVQIGSAKGSDDSKAVQTWMAENLKTTKINDGTPIDNITDASAWSSLYTPAYCIYDNNSANKNLYGVLYNWYAVQTGKLCPSGWHVFTDDDWKTLEKNIPGDFDANRLKETGTAHWPAPNSSSTNATGFTALPGGHRTNLGSFLAKGSNGQFWSSTEYSYTNAWNRGITYEFSEVLRKDNSKICGYSVRCLKD